MVTAWTWLAEERDITGKIHVSWSVEPVADTTADTNKGFARNPSCMGSPAYTTYFLI